MASKILLIVFAVILIALVSAANSEEINQVLGANSREARGVERKENGENRSANKKKKRQRKNKNRRRKGKGRKGRKRKNLKRKNCPKCPGCRLQAIEATDRPETVTLECVSDAVSAMKVWKDQVGNFLKRKKRIEKQLNIMDGKFSKRMDFSGISDNITFVGGGDASNLTCSGSNTSSKALLLGSLKTSIDSCNATIGTDCNSTLLMMDISLNSTGLEECFNITTNFTEQADLCMDSEAPCECWGALVNDPSFVDVKQCSFATEAKKVAQAKTKCTNSFSGCRGYERASNPAMADCSKSVSDLSTLASTLTANSAAVSSALTKIKSLTGSTRFFFRSITSCADLISNTTLLVSYSATSSSVSTVASKIGSASVTCNSTQITSLKSLQSDVTTLQSTITTKLSTVQSLLESSTGSTVASASSTATSTNSSSTASTSTSSSRLRRKLVL